MDIERLVSTLEIILSAKHGAKVTMQIKEAKHGNEND